MPWLVGIGWPQLSQHGNDTEHREKVCGHCCGFDMLRILAGARDDERRRPERCETLECGNGPLEVEEIGRRDGASLVDAFAWTRVPYEHDRIESRVRERALEQGREHARAG